jgi:hypothetical protein
VRNLSTSCGFHNRTAVLSWSWIGGASIFPVAIQACNVARDIFAARAACCVVKVFIRSSIYICWKPVKYYDKLSDIECGEHVRRDGNISPWIEDQDAAIGQLSARAVGFKLSPNWYDVFLRSLQENPDAGSLLKDFLPKCPIVPLAVFVTLIASAKTEETFNQLTRKRGQKLKAILRAGIRKGHDTQERLSRAERAFDVRRKGLAEYCYGALVLREYLRFRCGVKPGAKHLAVLLKAGLAASGKQRFQQAIDYDLLRRNLRNFEKRFPALCQLATGPRCAQMIEMPVHE